MPNKHTSTLRRRTKGPRIEATFKHKGLHCVVLMTDMGHRCGYVAIPPGHPLYAASYSKQHPLLLRSAMDGETIGKRGIIPLFCAAIDEGDTLCPDAYFNVHGGITYASNGGGRYPTRRTSKRKHHWWFGFDCAHCDDAPDLNEIEDPMLRRIYGELNDSLAALDSPRVVRSFDYVKAECESLAEQLLKVKP